MRKRFEKMSWKWTRKQLILPEPELINSESEEEEANSEARHFKRSWKRKH